MDWPPLAPEDLTITQLPGAPGAHAVILFREVFVNDEKRTDTFYYRIKVLTEEGKRYGNIEIPYIKEISKLEDFRARTVAPDGKAADFAGEIFEKTVVKSRYLKFLAKTITLPNVQVGTIIEYTFRMKWEGFRPFANNWTVQEELFTRRARFSIRPSVGILSLAWMGFLLPQKARPERQDDGSYRLELENIPAFEEEDYMPPESELKMRVQFFYTFGTIQPEELYWKEAGKSLYASVEAYIGNHKEIEKALSGIVSPGDTPETKLRKIYAWVQQLRNLDFEPPKKKEKGKWEEFKANPDVREVLKHGYGYRAELDRLFAALVRAAGLQATPVRVAKRDQSFFHSNLREGGQLNGEIIVVRGGDKEYFLDPGTKYCPFGLLPWEKTGVQGLRPDKEGGAFASTPTPRASDARTERKASLRLESDGTLRGKAQVLYFGQQALLKRLSHGQDEEAERKKEMESEIKGWLPADSTVTLESISGWAESETPLKMEFTVQIPNAATSTGRRLLLAPAAFHFARKHPFPHTNRVHPIYFPYPYEESDDITVELPADYRVENLPQPRKYASSFGEYEIEREQQGNTLRLRRRMTMTAIYLDLSYYPGLRRFYNTVTAGDQEQVVLQATAPQP